MTKTKIWLILKISREKEKRMEEHTHTHTHTHTMEYYSAIKKNEILPSVTTWMDLKDIVLSKNKSDRERLLLNDVTYVESKK